MLYQQVPTPSRQWLQGEDSHPIHTFRALTHLVEGHGSGVPDLLRYEACRRNEAQQGSDRSCTAAWQRADRDAARRNPL